MCGKLFDQFRPLSMQQFAEVLEKSSKVFVYEERKKLMGMSWHLGKKDYGSGFGAVQSRKESFGMDSASKQKIITSEVEACTSSGEHIYIHTSLSSQYRSTPKILELITSGLNELNLSDRDDGLSVASYASANEGKLELLDCRKRTSQGKSGCINWRTGKYQKDCFTETKGTQQVVSSNVKNMSRNNGSGYNYIYSLGLFDMMELNSACFLAGQMWRALKPGGRVIFVNFSHNVSEAFYRGGKTDGWAIRQPQDAMVSTVGSVLGGAMESARNMKQYECYRYLSIDKQKN